MEFEFQIGALVSTHSSIRWLFVSTEFRKAVSAVYDVKVVPLFVTTNVKIVVIISILFR